MIPTIDIRPARSTDAAVLIPLVGQYWRYEAIEGFDPARVATLLERVLSDAKLGHAWLALVDDAPAGYLLAVYVFSLEHQGLTAEIDELFVLQQYRGLGLGKRMLATAEETFRSGGCTNVSLQIGRDNVAARAFYRGRGYFDRAGFELVGKTL
jgi:GNAT superfamily N-acetyltransferase